MKKMLFALVALTVFAGATNVKSFDEKTKTDNERFYEEKQALFGDKCNIYSIKEAGCIQVITLSCNMRVTPKQADTDIAKYEYVGSEKSMGRYFHTYKRQFVCGVL